MAPITALLFCYRKPDLDAEQFRTYCEEQHVPLVMSLMGSDYRASQTRYYTNRVSGFVMGAPSDTSPDLVAVITYESEEDMQHTMRARMADGTREKIEADEDKFLDRSKLQLVVLGKDDIGRSTRVQ